MASEETILVPADTPVTPGGGRGAARELALCAAALELLADVGYDSMTMDAVAARARASKATIYRRWAGKREMVVDALRCRGPQPMEPADTGSLRGDLIDTFSAARDGFAKEDLDLLAGVLRAMRNAPEIGDEMRDQMLEQKRSTARTIVCRAVDRGELAAGADPDVLHEVGSALIVFRALVSGEPIDDAFIAHLADDILVPLLVASATRDTHPSARQETQ